MKALKVIAAALAVCLVLVIGLALLLPKLIDPNDYREQFEQAALEHTGLQVELAGPMSWSVFPSLGLSLSELKVTDRQQRPLAQLQEANVGIKLLPLIARKLEMDALSLNGLHLNLIRDQNGRGNWALAAQDATDKVIEPSAATAEQAPSEPASTERSADQQISLDIAAIEINDLKIDYQDLQAKQQWLLGPAQITTGAIRLDSPFKFSAHLPVSSESNAFAGTLDLNSQVLLKQNGFRFDQLSIQLAPEKGSEKLKLSGFVQKLDEQLELQLALAPHNPKKLLKAFGLGELNTQDAEALTQASVLLRAKGNSNALQLEPFTLELDQFNLNGKLQASNLSKNPKFNFELTGNTLDLDRYQPQAATPSSTEESDSAKQTSVAEKEAVTDGHANEELFPLALRQSLQSLDLAGSIKLEQLRVANLPLNKPHLQVRAEKGKLQIEALEANLFDGRIQHTSLLDLRKKPQLNSQTQLTSVQVQPLAQALSGIDALTGALNTDTNINSRFNTRAELLEQLNGQFKFKLTKGALEGVNINKLACSAIAKIRNESISKDDWPKSTAFNSVSGTWKIKNGVAHTRDMNAALDQLKLAGQGSVNLPKQLIDYRAALTLLGSTVAEDEPACTINEKYADVRWPIRCQGKLGQEGLCGIDSEALAQEVARLYGDEVKQKINKKLEEKLGQGGDELLKKLFQ